MGDLCPKLRGGVLGKIHSLKRVCSLTTISMSDKHEQEGGELLLDTDQPESAADGADDTDNDDGEQKQESLDLDDNDKLSKNEVAKGEEQRQKKISTYQARIDRGELTLDQLPPNEKWLAEHLQPKKTDAIIDKEAVRSVLQEERAKQAFIDQKEALANADLPSDKIQKLNEKFKLFRAKGLSKLDALEAAKEIAQIDLEELKLAPKRNAMKLPKPGGKSVTKDYEQLYKELPFSEAAKVIPEDALNEILKRSARS